jgi:hypothetical protein
METSVTHTHTHTHTHTYTISLVNAAGDITSLQVYITYIYFKYQYNIRHFVNFICQVQWSCISNRLCSFFGPPLWSSGQSSWLQIQRSRFDSGCYQIFWEVVGLGNGVHSASWVQSRSYLGEKVAAPVWKPEITVVEDPLLWATRHSLSVKADINFSDKRRSLGRYNSFADSDPEFLCSSFRLATGWMTEGVEFRVPVNSKMFSPCRTNWLWDPPSLLSKGYRGLFHRGKATVAWSWPLTSN